MPVPMRACAFARVTCNRRKTSHIYFRLYHYHHSQLQHQWIVAVNKSLCYCWKVRKAGIWLKQLEIWIVLELLNSNSRVSDMNWHGATSVSTSTTQSLLSATSSSSSFTFPSPSLSSSPASTAPNTKPDLGMTPTNAMFELSKLMKAPFQDHSM